jgi:hypothetical protein
VIAIDEIRSFDKMYLGFVFYTVLISPAQVVQAISSHPPIYESHIIISLSPPWSAASGLQIHYDRSLKSLSTGAYMTRRRLSKLQVGQSYSNVRIQQLRQWCSSLSASSSIEARFSCWSRGRREVMEILQRNRRIWLSRDGIQVTSLYV